MLSSDEGFRTKKLNLTCRGISSVNWEISDPDFEFIFRKKVCRVHSVLAEFLSPKIARNRKCDPLCSFYTFKDSKMFSIFESLLSNLRSGHPIRVKKSNFLHLVRLSQEFENDELLSSLIGMINIDSLNLDEAILLLSTGIDLGTAFSDRFGNLRNLVASHFYEIEKKTLDNLDLETLQLLISSPSLRIEDEDALYDFIRSRSQKDLRFASLFEFVYFDYLSANRIDNFSSFVTTNLLGNLNSGIWERLCRCLISKTGKSKGKHSRVFIPPPIEFVYNGSKHLEGVIAHLTRECGGNVHDKGIVYVLGSGVGLRNVVDFTVDSSCQPERESLRVCYYFSERSVIPKSYSVRASDRGYLRSWVIEVSNDGYSWVEIDRRDNVGDLSGKYAEANFKIPRVPRESFRFFRLRETSQGHQITYGAQITALEIFGTLSVTKKIEEPPKYEFVYHADREGRFPPPLFPPKLDGVIAHLTRECGGNVHDQGLVNVTASSVSMGGDPRNVVDLGTNSLYSSENENNTWICYDFKDRRIIPTSYSVRTSRNSPGGDTLKSWVIEVSKDGTENSWVEIDRRDDSHDLNCCYVTVNFKISRVPSESFRFFRLRETGPNHYGDHHSYYVNITSLEIFGTLWEK